MKNIDFTLDCSVAMAWIFSDEVTPATERLLNALERGATAYVPALWHLEIGNVLLGARRKKRIDQFGIETFLRQLTAFNIFIDEETTTRTWNKTSDLAWQCHLSVYDAAYLELALRKNLPLATLDKSLRAAAVQMGVALLP